jgi:hypothetical protein
MYRKQPQYVAAEEDGKKAFQLGCAKTAYPHHLTHTCRNWWIIGWEKASNESGAPECKPGMPDHVRRVYRGMEAK